MTAAKVKSTGSEPGSRRVLVFQHFAEARLNRADGQPYILLAFKQGYRINRDEESISTSFRASTTFYEYKLSNNEGRELVTYHWHPHEPNSILWPHLHIGSAVIDTAEPGFGKRFSRLHLPTSRISIEQVIRAAISQFDVIPTRQDWESVLDDGQQLFEQRRRWN